MRACELDDALGGDLSFEVLKGGGLHQVVTEVVPVGGGADQKKKKKRERKKKKRKEFLCCSVFEWGAKKGLEFSVACLQVCNVLCCKVLEFW